MIKLRALATVLLLATAACGVARLLGLQEKPSRLFSHKVHGSAQELECLSCHPTAEKEDKAGMPPSLKKCMLCHEGIDEKKSPPQQLAALYPGEKPAWSAVTALPDEVIFSHKTHQAAKLACSECHAGIEHSEAVTENVRVGKDACMTCHARRGKSNDCAVCHRVLRKDLAPSTHARNWRPSHGHVVRSGEDLPYANRCALCHTETSCTTCHQDETPRNHTNFWRIQGHAVAADVDRSSCATCHRSDFCDRCHRETAPRSHLLSWSGPGNRHCVSCHIPLSQDACFTCHRQASHMTAPRRPADPVHAGADEAGCRTCHTGATLPHADNGDGCANCH
ncbi:MAG: cytochrome c3 family protein [Planctomycetes bacterium]|nr:cytochrome c3 family protein [Planctomycetota bacterium]